MARVLAVTTPSVRAHPHSRGSPRCLNITEREAVRGWRSDAFSQCRSRGPNEASARAGVHRDAQFGTALRSPPSRSDSTATAPAVRLATAGSRVPAGAARLGPLPSDRQLTMSVILRPSHTAELTALLHDLYDPSSPRYEQWLATGEFNREFGPSADEVAAVTSWLHSKGLSDTTVQGMTVTTTGRARDFARAFGVSFTGYRLASRRDGLRRVGAPARAERGRRRHRDHRRALRHRALRQRARSATARGSRRTRRRGRRCRTGLSDSARVDVRESDQLRRPHLLDAAPGRQPLPRERTVRGGPDRQGEDDRTARARPEPPVRHESVPLVLRAPQRREDRAHRRRCATRTRPGHSKRRSTPRRSRPRRRARRSSRTKRRTTRPASTTRTAGSSARIAAQVVSTSWGKCEAGARSGARFRGQPVIDALHTVFQQAAAQGQSVFAATGDTGSEDCYDGTVDATERDTAGRQPRRRSVRHRRRRHRAPATGSGAGVERMRRLRRATRARPAAARPAAAALSNHFKRPSWQPLASNATCTTCREVPDISANAGVGETFYDSDSSGPNRGSGPRWAARASPPRCSPASRPTSPKDARAAGSATSRRGSMRSPRRTCTAPRSST